MRHALPALLIAAMLSATSDRAHVVVDNPTSGLRTWEVGEGRDPLVLLHGYSSAPGEWLQFTDTIRPRESRRFVFPEAPGTGPGGRGRGWWPLDLASHLDSSGLPDLSRTRPPGLETASRRVGTLLDEIVTRLGGPADQLILGGFSQGGMVSAEIAFRSGRPLKALILLSPTTIDVASWRAGFPARRQLPVFLSHGRNDTVLPFAASERLAADLRRAGLRVMWVPFDGIHDMPTTVVDALNQFLTVVDR
jgi:phospholipase/carboxylesterase